MYFRIDTTLTKKMDSSSSLLGCGYDCKFSLIKGNDYIRNRIIDVKRLLNGEGYDYIKHLSMSFPLLEINKAILHQSGYSHSLISATLDKHVKDLMEISGVKTSIGNIQLKLFRTVTNSFNNKSTGNIFFTYEYFRPTCILTLPEVYPEYLCYFLSDSFIKDLYSKSADDIVRIYGTHVLTDITLGGWISVSAIAKLSSKGDEKEMVKSMNLYYNHFYNSSYSANGNRYFPNCDSIICNIHMTGGNQSDIEIKDNQIVGFQKWLQNINLNNEQIVDIGSIKKILLLSDFIMDVSKKKEIEDAIIRYCN
ncbi:hypothetical protein Bache_2425 [Bacteroides helcogenes P 36-108]|uniref:Uncharacterized protein n=2 Tax=Bacteroides helcogenes TaxID=290053 RepID=E6SUP6_BACT6|nr:hypothetical protein Bache_2425 [Bacteroides helcogenes P 36-108]